MFQTIFLLFAATVSARAFSLFEPFPRHRSLKSSIQKLNDVQRQDPLLERSLFMTSPDFVSSIDVAAASSSTSSSSTDAAAKTTTSSKVLYLIRHGTSLANEFMRQPGNQWGDPTFRDDMRLRDAGLSPHGRSVECGENLVQELRSAPWLDQIELIVVSPLTRCLETYHYGVAPAFRHTPPVIVLPWIAERVYTASDIGSPLATLKQQWTELDWSLVRDSWWYDPPAPEDAEVHEEEWRPHGQGQWYAVPGEPMRVFQARMAKADAWLQQRPEKNILIVTHWGVVRHWTNREVPNCHVCRLEWKGPVALDE